MKRVLILKKRMLPAMKNKDRRETAGVAVSFLGSLLSYFKFRKDDLRILLLKNIYIHHKIKPSE